MTSAALARAPTRRRSFNPWIVAAAVVVPTFMEVLDTTIANVALRYIAGGLSASVNDSEWVITSYLAANATILPISGWLSNRLGRRNYFLISIAVFTIASGLCGVAGSLEELILFRVIQGLAGGGLQPSSQGILIDAFPPEKQGSAMTLFAIAGLIAPVIGPTLGGYLTVFYEWRWIFYINLPVGALGCLVCYLVVEDPPYLKETRAELLSRPFRFDYLGLSLLIMAVTCWEILLSKGQEWDWYADPTWRAQSMAIVFVLALTALIVHELRTPDPVVNLRPLADRNFAACSLIVFSVYGILYATSTTLPGLLQTLFGYDAYASGLVLSPSGIGSVLMLLTAGFLLGRGTDARWLILAGLILMAAGNYWMSVMNLAISPYQVIWPRVVTFMGISLIFAPLTVAAFQGVPQQYRGAAVGLFALLRNEGGSVGTSLAKTLAQRRSQFHSARLGEFIDPLNPQVQEFLNQGQSLFRSETGDPVGSSLMSLQALEALRDQQAASLAYFDDFWLFSVLSLSLIGLIFFMRRSVAEKGAHIGAE
ncbi:MFS transporter, DHA2 family, multidrug resistance protein [Singulisphaera sp. GP187]|uniref:DHA2 family efflux MFS transporter permease subunit n=1 Tax=Singulisphaera sp. GP187 TaxID=1882752 RepID=UPI00092C940A|nr:DHA2 family efflux MFS transporter permease subunit [Singulisphaera sp. GP187]SIN74011.1 MFS transporter, DHA2 family, multidrug resistance protein [Singulisphaera sp. GP187]